MSIAMRLKYKVERDAPLVTRMPVTLLMQGDEAANEIVVEMAGEVLPVVKKTPVIAGVNGTDPFVVMPVFLKRLKELGFSGVQNFPTVGIIDGTPMLDLPYVEDVRAQTDMNVVQTGSGRFVEVQGTAEHAPFDRDELDVLLDLASTGNAELAELQARSLAAQLGETLTLGIA